MCGCENVKMIDRPPLLEEPFAQTLLGIEDTKAPGNSNCLLTIDHVDPLWHRGKGFLAADESAGPWLRARNAEAAKIPDTGPHLMRT